MRVVRAVLLAVIFLSGCQSVPLHTTYDPIGYKPKNPSKVVIKVSLENRMVYVLEGGKPLLVTATAVGLPSKPTPRGHFRVTRKIANKRSGSYGFWVKGDTVVPGKSSKAPGSGYRYVGYPMQYWVEWMPAYGFHLDPYGLCPERTVVCAFTKTLRANFSNSPALAPRSILRGGNPRTPPWGKTSHVPETTMIPTHRTRS